jgi:catechol 2,3-dioxygenase-like lactoylglutathione lyase family enzyme
MLGDTKAYSSFAVDDLDKAREFSGETLGVEVSSQEDEMPVVVLRLAGGRELFVYEKADHTPATYTVLNFAVEDVEKAVDALTARGVTFERYEGFGQDEKGIARGDGPEIAWFKDPAGNVLSVMDETS